jgi:hypothetical protein
MSLQKGLVSHWTMDDVDTSSGTLYDKSAYSNDATLVNSPTTGATGVLAEAYDFNDANTEHCTFPKVSAFDGGEFTFTVSAWVKTTSFGQAIHPRAQYDIDFEINSTARLGWYDGSNPSAVSASTAVDDGTFHHIVWQADTTSGEQFVYVDGVLEGSDTLTFDPASISSSNRIARKTGGGFDATIDEIRIYDRVLSSSEVNALYQMREQRQQNVSPYQLRPKAGSGPNLMDATQWTVGTNGSQGTFSQNGASNENSIIKDDTPYGDLAPIWYGRSESTDDSSDGGWNWYELSTSDIDRNKTYRYSVWMKQEYNSGSFYHGTENVEDSNGNFNANPYYASGDLPTLNDWYLLVGFNHPQNASKSLNESAIYDIDGNKVRDIQDFWWEDGSDFGTEGMRWRSYYFYDTNVGRGVRFYDPRLEIMEDAHTSLSAMFNAARDFSDGRDRIWFDGFESGNLNKTWTITDGDISNTRQFAGSNSFGQWGGGNSVEATWNPYDGEKKISEFEYYWKEDGSQTGQGVWLYDGNGDLVQRSESENPQWYLNDGSGGRFEVAGYDGQGYNVWTKFTFTFDWQNGTYDYDMEDLDGNVYRTGTTDLDKSTGVSEIRFHGAGASANYVRFDNITVRK